jgi:hypothetical protein
VRYLFILILALIMLVISACFSDLELIVKNNTTADAWVRLDGGYERYIRAQGSISLSVSSPRVVNLQYRGRHLLPGNIYVDMDISGVRHLNLEPNCGALRVHNSAMTDIRSLSISESGTYNWSANLLDHYLSLGEYDFFSLSPGYYDLRIRDQHNNYYYATALHITLDNTRNYTFTGF